MKFTKMDLARKYRDEYGMEMPTRKLARIMYKKENLSFKSEEDARNVLQKIEGKSKGGGHKITHPFPPRSCNPYNLPESHQEKREPFKLPTQCNNILLMSDLHIPYHDIEALTIALEYGVKEKVNTIVILGDLIDFHKASRFQPDPKKRSIKEIGRAHV